MSPLSKVWAKWLLVGQYANVIVMVIVALMATPDVGILATWKQHLATIHGTIVGVLASLQAVADALPDADKDGIPDLFDDTPNGPTE